MQEAHFPTFNDCIGSGHFQDELTSLTFQSRWGAARDCNVNKILRKMKRVYNAKGEERTQDISGYLSKRKRVHIQCQGRGAVEQWDISQVAPTCSHLLLQVRNSRILGEAKLFNSICEEKDTIWRWLSTIVFTGKN